jgi:hypothetical protein
MHIGSPAAALKLLSRSSLTVRIHSRVTLKSLMNDEPNGCGVRRPACHAASGKGVTTWRAKMTARIGHLRDRKMQPYSKDTHVQLLCQGAKQPRQRYHSHSVITIRSGCIAASGKLVP